MVTSIESGTTAWWRNRHLLYMVMLFGMAGWFAYDAYIKYPAKNLEWALQTMPAEKRTPNLKANPAVTADKLNTLERELAANGRLSLDHVKSELGEPTLVAEDPDKGTQYLFAGPAGFAKITAPGRTTEGKIQIEHSKEYSASSIWGQKLFAALAMIPGLILTLRLINILRTRVVLDETGFRYNGTRIAWDEMTGLQNDDYGAKGWVDLEYTSGGAKKTFRLDSYHIARFNEIITAICENKGFPSPLNAPDFDAQPEDASSPPT